MKKLFFVLASVLLTSLAVYAQDSASFTDYYGKYKFPDGSPVNEVGIVWIDNILNITSDMGNATMEMLDVDSFSMSYQDGIIKFSRDSLTHKVSGLTIFVSGTVLEGTKEKPEDKGSGFMNKDMKKEERVSG